MDQDDKIVLDFDIEDVEFTVRRIKEEAVEEDYDQDNDYSNCYENEEEWIGPHSPDNHSIIDIRTGLHDHDYSKNNVEFPSSSLVGYFSY